jgi:hypothetical protein
LFFVDFSVDEFGDGLTSIGCAGFAGGNLASLLAAGQLVRFYVSFLSASSARPPSFSSWRLSGQAFDTQKLPPLRNHQ